MQRQKPTPYRFSCLARRAADRRLLRHSRLPGRLRLAMIGRSERLLRQRRIDRCLRFPRENGVVLDVWTIRGRGRDAPEADGARGTVLIVHGLWDSKGRFFGLGERLGKMGFDVVLPDLRAHGASTGRYVTFGALEKRDLLALTEQLAEQGRLREPLYVFGFSMGAAIAVQYAALEPRCRGVVAVSPFKDAHSIARRIVPLMSRRRYKTVWRRAAEIATEDGCRIYTSDLLDLVAE